jgi:methyltransferase (TIGR00027 family)
MHHEPKAFRSWPATPLNGPSRRFARDSYAPPSPCFVKSQPCNIERSFVLFTVTNSQPSRTAEYMAFFRAIESVRASDRRLFVDSFASRFIRPSLRAAVWLSRRPILAALVNWYADRRLPGARTSAIARTRLIDDALGGTSRENIRQIAILGAGFDCRAYRLSGLKNTLVFEVDHPATLATKLARLRGVLPKIPDTVRFVGIDFNHQALPAVLTQAGFQSSQPAVFLWEGVTNYLTPEAVDSVLRYVASCSPGTQIVFTYVHSGVLDGSAHFEGAARVLQDVARLNEPWTFGILPHQLAEFLTGRGLCLDRDLSARDYRSRYFGAAAPRMKGYDFYHVAIAHVPKEKTASRGIPDA